jgi:hypothetical protein
MPAHPLRNGDLCMPKEVIAMMIVAMIMAAAQWVDIY